MLIDLPRPLDLSPEEVDNLLEDKTPATLLAMTSKIATAYAQETFKFKESQAAEQIFRLLMRDTELRVRAALAEQIKNSQLIPRDIVMSLAQDVAEVALPVLQFCEVFTDEDLIEIIANSGEIQKYLAISKRTFLSGDVTDTLIERGNDEVAAALVANQGARLTDHGLSTIITHYPENAPLMHAVSTRPHLPPAIAQKLIHVVSTSLADSLKRKYKLPGAQLEPEVEKAREGETLGLVRTSQSQEDIDKLITQLIAQDHLTPSIILSALCQGNFGFFETSLARLSGIATSNARKLIADKGELGFRALYSKSGLPDTMFPAVKLLLKIVRELDEIGEHPGSPHYANRVVERILQYCESTQPDNMAYIIALVRKVGHS
jgi:uncharacterized protein (DUF2336 family)